MARPRQKKKNKSPLPRIRQKPNSKRINIQSNPIVAASWDKSLTLSQNYRRLGLSARLNSSSGGIEPLLAKAAEDDSDSAPKVKEASDPFLISGQGKPKSEIGCVKVIRDAEGRITGIFREGNEEEERGRRNPLGDLVTDLEDKEAEQARIMMGKGAGIVPKLEEASRLAKKPKKRKQSQREAEWIQRLVERWGDDFRAMVRDQKLNPMQQSEGDLKRRVESWQRNQQGEQGEKMEVG